MTTNDDLEIPEFLKREFDLEAWRAKGTRALRRRAAGYRIKYPDGGYSRLLRRQQMADERAAMQARFAKLRGQP